MAKEPTISSLTSGYASNTALNVIFDAIKAAFSNTVSRDGSTPNTMEADFDLNGNDLLNVGSLDVDSLTIGNESFTLSQLTGFTDVAARLLSPSATNPASRDDGSALEVGDIYYNTTDLKFKVWSGSTFFPIDAAQVTVDTFDGDNSETEFALSSEPDSEDNTLVFVDNSYVSKADYSVSGTTLTFTTAPSSGTGNVEVVTTGFETISVSFLAIASRTSLKATDTNQVAFFDGSLWIYDSSVANSIYSDDTQEGVLVSPTGSGDGAWVRQYDEGRVNIHWFQANANGVDNDAAVIQAAVDFLLAHPEYGSEVYLPAKYNGSTPSTRKYRCTSKITIPNPDNLRVMGDGSNLTFIDFNNDTDGFHITSTTTGQNSFVSIGKMLIRGNAHTSSVSTATAGLRLENLADCAFPDLIVQRFVDLCVNDADPTGTSATGFIDVDYTTFIGLQNDFPNPANQYPRYGVHNKNSSASTFKPQTVVYHDSKLYSNITVKSTTQNGTGAQVSFVLSGLVGLSKASGIKVNIKDANDNWTRKALTTDYDLYDYTGSVRGTQITAAMSAKDAGNPMPNNNGADITDVEVVFKSAPASATGNVSIVYNDPWGLIGYYNEVGSGNIFRGSIGGYETGVLNGGSVADNNEFRLAYAQLCDVLFDSANTGTVGWIATCLEHSTQHVDQYSSSNVQNCLLDELGPTRRITDKRTSDLTLTGTFQDVLTFTVPNEKEGTFREVKGVLSVDATETSTTRVAVDYELQASYDSGGSYSTLRLWREEFDITSATGVDTILNLPFDFVDETSVTNVFARRNVLYRVRAKSVAGDTLVANGSGSSQFCHGSATIVNP